MRRYLYTFLFLFSSLYAGGIDWYNDFDSAKNASKSSDKVLMMMYTRPDCPACLYMKNKVFSDERVESFIIKNFIALEIDLDLDDAVEGYKVFGTPTFYFIDPNGEKIDLIVGGAKADSFKERLKKVLQKRKK